MPVLGKMLLRTGLALCGSGSGAVAFHRRTRRALVAHEEVGRHRVAVLVLWRYVLLLEGPGKGSCEELQEGESRFSTESTAVTKSLMKPISCTEFKIFFFFIFWSTRQPKASSKRELKERSEL